MTEQTTLAQLRAKVSRLEDDLKDSYFRQAASNLRAAETNGVQGDMFQVA